MALWWRLSCSLAVFRADIPRISGVRDVHSEFRVLLLPEMVVKASILEEFSFDLYDRIECLRIVCLSLLPRGIGASHTVHDAGRHLVKPRFRISYFELFECRCLNFSVDGLKIDPIVTLIERNGSLVDLVALILEALNP